MLFPRLKLILYSHTVFTRVIQIQPKILPLSPIEPDYVTNTMKKLFLIPLISLFLVPPKETNNATNKPTYNFSIKLDDCGSYKGKKLNRGPRGG